MLLLGACQRSAEERAGAQRALGETLYTQQCAACHEFQQGIGPTLTVETLASYGTAKTLFNYIRLAMPTQNPGSLSEEEYRAIVAYLLHSRALLPANQPLDGETMEGLILEKKESGAGG